MTAEQQIAATIGSIPQWLDAVGSLAQAAVVGIAAWIAHRGLNTWRRQRIIGKRIDLAEEGLRGFLEIREALIHITNGASFGHERERVKLEILSDLDEVEFERCWAYAVPLLRLKEYSDVLERFLSSRYLMQAYFGDEIELLYAEIKSIIVEAKGGAEALIRHYGQGEYIIQRGGQDEFLRRMQARIWWGLLDDDPQNIRLREAIEKATRFFREFLNVE